MKIDADIQLLEEWFQCATEDELVIDADHINVEANGNFCAFSPPPGVDLGVEQVVAFIRRVVAHRAGQISGHAMTFYCWHDMQTRQLRLSLVSRSHGHLPFGCHHAETLDINSVVRPIVFDDWRTPRDMAWKDDGLVPDEAERDEPFFSEERPLRVGVITPG